MAGTFIVLSSLVLLAAAAVSLRRWRQDPDSGPARWSLATFVILAAVLIELTLTEYLSAELGEWSTKSLLAVLVFFPYSLFRFSRSFRGIPNRLDHVALAVTATLSLTAFMLPGLDAGGDDSGGSLRIYLLALLVQWTVLSLTAAAQLLKAGSGLPAIARRRMRLTGGAVLGLNVAIALTLIPEDTQLDSPAQMLVFVTSLLFFLGVAPPPFLRQLWRQSDQAAFDRTIEGLMGAVTSEQVGSVLLRDAVALVGAEEAELVDRNGSLLARTGDRDASLPPAQPSSRNVEEISLGDQGLSLIVTLSPYAPYFGAEETSLLRTIAALAKLSLERNSLFEEQSVVVNDLRNEINERVRVEEELHEARSEAERANLAKSDFLSRMSHELRTPLNAILGFAQLLELEELPPDQRDSTEQIVKGGRRLLDLINEVLDIARIETGTLQLSLEPVPVGEVVRDAIDLIRPLATERRIRLRSEVAPEIMSSHVMADQQRLGQAVLNLLSNAVKYNVDEGAVSVAAVEDEAGLVHIGVRDTGPGIPDDKISLLFTPFERLGAEATTVEGTGLGLALSKSLIEAMGGTLGVDTVRGQGTTFWISLRATQGPIEEPVAPVLSSGEERVDSPKKVLYVEDNLSNLRLVQRLVAREQHLELISAMTGTLGLEMAQQHRPDLVLLDLHLPDLQGTELLVRLQKDPRTSDIPVVVLSADATSRQIERLRKLGATEYLTKPIDVLEFNNVLTRLISSGQDHNGQASDVRAGHIGLGDPR